MSAVKREWEEQIGPEWEEQIPFRLTEMGRRTMETLTPGPQPDTVSESINFEVIR